MASLKNRRSNGRPRKGTGSIRNATFTNGPCGSPCAEVWLAVSEWLGNDESYRGEPSTVDTVITNKPTGAQYHVTGKRDSDGASCEIKFIGNRELEVGRGYLSASDIPEPPRPTTRSTHAHRHTMGNPLNAPCGTSPQDHRVAHLRVDRAALSITDNPSSRRLTGGATSAIRAPHSSGSTSPTPCGPRLAPAPPASCVPLSTRGSVAGSRVASRLSSGRPRGTGRTARREPGKEGGAVGVPSPPAFLPTVVIPDPKIPRSTQ